MIDARNLEKVYESSGVATRALAGVSVHIGEGEFVSIMGPSGSGKSTLLHILSFLDRPSSGEYIFDGRNIEELGDGDLARIRNKNIGFVFQSFNLLGRSSVYENVELPLLYSRGMPPSERRARILDAIHSVGLEDKTRTEAGKLSGGQKQRVAIARALVNDPSIIFADEPTGNLDSKSGAQIMEILRNLHGAGRTIILVTHETYTAEFAERLIELKDGTIVTDRSVKKSNSRFFK